MSEVEGTVQGHRDGHGFVIRDDRQPDLYLSAQEMRAVLHRDRVKARVVRYDRKGRPLRSSSASGRRSSAASCTRTASGSSLPKTSATARTF